MAFYLQLVGGIVIKFHQVFKKDIAYGFSEELPMKKLVMMYLCRCLMSLVTYLNKNTWLWFYVMLIDVDLLR